MAIWSRLTAAIAGLGIGGAGAAAIEPVLEPLRQDAWSKVAPRVLNVATLGQLAASGLISRDEAVAEGRRTGYAAGRVDRSIQLSLKAAPVAELLELWRRGKISEALVDHGLAKASIEPHYWTPIKELFYGRLDPSIVAVAIQRGIMRDPGFLPVAPSAATGKVPAFPVSPLDPIDEVKASGIDEPRLFVETAIVGNPMAPDQAAQAFFRSIIERADFDRAISEGNTRNEWRDAILDYFRQIPTAHDGIEYRLRGWTDDAGMYAQTARHGMSKADTDLLLKVTGRPLSFHQVFIGERRGGTFGGPTTGIDPAFLKSLQESNIRPEWYDLAWAQRHTLPSAFVLRALLTGGVITAAQGEGYFLDIGWPPALAKQVADFYGAGTAAKADSHVSKAQTQLWTTLHRSYLAGESTQAEVSAALPRAGVSAAAIADVLATWDEERTIIRKQLSPAQVKKAYVEGVLNPDTGAAWTKDEATAALVARGYSTADATTFLEL